ncbi:hypothetical protein L596_025931 [Steinernema carpocapsae]|uniref:Homeobox domain-containing protein n=1 Tax=Steinernema carpocapsae TaxID=34508 RepID=A0A4U5M9A6_STECR|nr:hypothetical protein L596_025931 [Steinernema carpocapsae]
MAAIVTRSLPTWERSLCDSFGKVGFEQLTVYDSDSDPSEFSYDSSSSSEDEAIEIEEQQPKKTPKIVPTSKVTKASLAKSFAAFDAKPKPSISKNTLSKKKTDVLKQLYLTSPQVDLSRLGLIGKQLGMTQKQVKTWFQNKLYSEKMTMKKTRK